MPSDAKEDNVENAKRTALHRWLSGGTNPGEDYGDVEQVRVDDLTLRITFT
jgi:hypothetical protein